jgi:hypothetical protein
VFDHRRAHVFDGADDGFLDQSVRDGLSGGHAVGEGNRRVIGGKYRGLS